MAKPTGNFCQTIDEAAKKGNTAMLIWLGKQLLDQVDKREVREESTVTQVSRLVLTPGDQEFLKRKMSLT